MAKKWLILLAIAVAAAVALRPIWLRYRIHVPQLSRPSQQVLLEQNWTPAQRTAFHHTAQGTRLIPWTWFKALEQPCFSPFGCGKFSDPAYLLSFGFVPSPGQPDNLPIGFARHDNFHDPILKRNYPVVGLTCAACHTGELFYKDYAIRVEGGPGMADLAMFQKAVGVALGLTRYYPGRYSKFEREILGESPSDAQKAALKQDLDHFLEYGKKEFDYTREHEIYDNLAGFGRTDALTRIGNQVFAVDLNVPANFEKANAAVRFPQIWDAPWLDWVQYNSSIADPLVRNIGEALGVRALLTPEDMDSSVDVEALNNLEVLVAGDQPYKGLNSPKWPSVFPPLDAEKVKQGEALYRKHCIGCHLPPVTELIADRATPEPKFWVKSASGTTFLKVTDINIQRIGTDPRAALDFRSRTADSGPLNKGRLTAAQGLDVVTRTIANRYFEQNNFPPEKRLLWSGYRTPGVEAVRDRLIYKARPLNGIWAAAPFLHNGSVPSLYLLLSPHSERPAKFWTGTKQFLPGDVGFDTAEIDGAYEYDTSAPGNSNRGHEFNDGKRGNGNIGPLLPPADRHALVEYLKSL